MISTYSRPVTFIEKKTRKQPIFKYSRLDNSEAEEVCKLILSGKTNTEISKYTGLPEDTIFNIKAGRCFSDLSERYNTKALITARNEPLPTITVINICEYIKQYPTANNSYVADVFSCSYSQVRDIRQGKSYKAISKKYLFNR